MSRLRQAALVLVCFALPASAQSFPQVNISSANVAQVQQQISQAQQIQRNLNQAAQLSAHVAGLRTEPLARATVSQDLPRPVEERHSSPMALEVHSLETPRAQVVAPPRVVMMSREQFAREDLPRVKRRLDSCRIEMALLAQQAAFDLLGAAEPFLVNHQPLPPGVAEQYSGEGESTLRAFRAQWNEYLRLWALRAEYQRLLGLPVSGEQPDRAVRAAVAAARASQPSEVHYEVHDSSERARGDSSSSHDFSRAQQTIDRLSNFHF